MPEKEEILNRLRRVEGQVRGLVRMVEKESSSCEDVLTQLLAARAALDKVGLEVISAYLEHCLPDGATPEDCRQARRNLYRVLELLMRLR